MEPNLLTKKTFFLDSSHNGHMAHKINKQND